MSAMVLSGTEEAATSAPDKTISQSLQKYTNDNNH